MQKLYNALVCSMNKAKHPEAIKAVGDLAVLLNVQEEHDLVIRAWQNACQRLGVSHEFVTHDLQSQKSWVENYSGHNQPGYYDD